MSSNQNKRPALGKGLGALLEGSRMATAQVTMENKEENPSVNSIAMLPITSIEANPFNPRTDFEEASLQELADSIATHGIIQPLTVRKVGRNKYQLISGERRFKASQLAELKEVPAYIRVANDQTMLEMALVENIQRENLNAIEIALSYQRLIEECDLTQEELAKQISKSRTSITNHLRLLKLPVTVQLAVRENEISMGHARAIAGLDDAKVQIRLTERIIDEQLSVRDIENIIRDKKEEKKSPTSSTPSLATTTSQSRFISDLSSRLSSKIQLKKQPKGNGKLVINFDSEVDLNRIIELLKDKI